MENTSKQGKLEKIKQRFDTISYKGVVLNVPFLIFLAILALMYISNSNNGVALFREIEKKKKVLEETRWRYKDTEANLIYSLSERQISQKTAPMNIKPLDKPAFEIQSSKDTIVHNRK